MKVYAQLEDNGTWSLYDYSDTCIKDGFESDEDALNWCDANGFVYN